MQDTESKNNFSVGFYKCYANILLQLDSLTYVFVSIFTPCNQNYTIS